MVPTALVVVALLMVAPLMGSSPRGFEPRSSWPSWGGGEAHTFHAAAQGAASEWNYAPWALRDGDLGGSGRNFLGTLVGDLDGDGPEEVVAVVMPALFLGQSAQLRVWERDGSPRWTRDLLSPANHAVLLDWDRKPGFEIHVIDGPLVEVFAGSGALLYSVPLPESRPCGVHCSYTLAADLNGDALDDVVVASAPPLTTVPGAGSSATVFAVDGASGARLWEFPLGCGWSAGSQAALAKEGRARLFLTCRQALYDSYVGGSVVYAVDSEPRTGVLKAPMETSVAWSVHFTEQRGYAREGGTPRLYDAHSIAVGDVTGDAIPEVVVAVHAPHGIHVINERDGLLIAQWQSDPSRVGYALALGNLDADAALEIIQGDDRGGVAAFDFAEGALSQSWYAQVVTPRPRAHVTAIATGDLDGDGRDETVAPIQGGEYCGDGVTNYEAVVDGNGRVLWLSNPLDRCTTPVNGLALADLDRDGDVEILQPAADRFLIFGVGPQPAPSAQRR